jgi:ubiquinone/menaquinone biosynthesis C-methylase UbiE
MPAQKAGKLCQPIMTGMTMEIKDETMENRVHELQSIQNDWNSIAESYDKFVTPTGKWALPIEALHYAGLQSGMSFLDVASGSGALSLPAARHGARVHAIDISSVMIECLQKRAADEELTDIEVSIMDGQALEFEDNTFDISGSQFGVMLFPNLKQGLREMVRVTKPGGRVLMVAYGPPPKVEFLGVFMQALKAVVPGFTGLPSNPPPLPFQASEPDVLRQRMEEVGLKEVQIHKSLEKVEFSSGTEMWNWVVHSNPIPAMLVKDLTNEQVSIIKDHLDQQIHSISGDKPPAVLSAHVNIGIGIK